MIRAGFPQPVRSQAEGLINRAPAPRHWRGIPSWGCWAGEEAQAPAGRDSPAAHIPVSLYPCIPILCSPFRRRRAGGAQGSRGVCPSWVLGPHCPCADPRRLQELPSPPRLLPAPRACYGSRDMAWQGWNGTTWPCS